MDVFEIVDGLLSVIRIPISIMLLSAAVITILYFLARMLDARKMFAWMAVTAGVVGTLSGLWAIVSLLTPTASVVQLYDTETGFNYTISSVRQGFFRQDIPRAFSMDAKDGSDISVNSLGSSQIIPATWSGRYRLEYTPTSFSLLGFRDNTERDTFISYFDFEGDVARMLTQEALHAQE